MKKLFILFVVLSSCREVSTIETTRQVEPEYEKLTSTQYTVTKRNLIVTDFEMDGCEYIMVEEPNRYTSLNPVHKGNCKNH